MIRSLLFSILDHSGLFFFLFGSANRQLLKKCWMGSYGPNNDGFGRHWRPNCGNKAGRKRRKGKKRKGKKKQTINVGGVVRRGKESVDEGKGGEKKEKQSGTEDAGKSKKALS